MNLNGTSSSKMCFELRRQFNKLASNLNEILRAPVSALTTWNQSEKTGRRERSRITYEPPEWKFALPRDKKDFLVLCCVSWYLDEEIGTLLRLELYEKRNKFGPDYYTKISLLLESEAKMICYILESNVLGNNANEVFGNILAANLQKPQIFIFNSQRKEDSSFWKFKGVRLTFINSTVKKPQFHRGYRDKGSLNPGSSIRRELKIDFSTTELQNQIEEDRESRDDATAFISGFLD